MAGYDIGPKISLKGESAFNQSISKIQNNLRVLGSEMEKTTTEFAGNSRSVEALTAKNKILNKQIEEQKKIFSTIANELEKQKDKLKEYGQALQKAQESGDPREIAKAEKAYQDQERAVSRLTVAFNEASTSITRLEQDFESNNQAIQDSSRSLGKFRDIAQEVEKQTSNIGEKISKMGDLIATSMAATIKAIAAVGTALAGAATAAIKVGSDFENGMSKVAAISGATKEDLIELTEKAKEMGAKTKFSATESAAAFEYMAMAGWKTQDMLNGIEGIMNLAAASGEELASVSDIVTDALTAFGLQAKDSAHFADVLAKASSSSNTNVGLMGETFQYVAPVAGAMKYSIEDTALAIGLMANAGIKGSQSGTALRAVITRLVKPPKMAAEALEELGFTALKADGTVKPLRETLVELREKFSTLTDAEKANTAARLAGTEAMSGLLSIVNASEQDFQKLAASIDDSTGAALNMAEVMQDNLQGQITILGSALEGLGIEFYEKVQVPMKEATKKVISYVEDITKAFKKDGLYGAVKEAGNVFAKLAAQAVEAAPQMAQASVELIQGFITGIKKNSKKIVSAAKELAKVLADSLVSLLPEQLQKPLQKTINIIANVLQNLGKVVSNIAKKIIPVFTKSIEFLGNNLDKIVPLLTAVVVTMKTWSAIQTAANFLKSFTMATEAASVAVTAFIAANGAEAVATAASTGALTLKQVAVGALNKQIGLATAAQYLWNASMTANPIGIIITLLGAAGAAILAYNLTQKEAITTSEIFAESQRNLVNTYQDGIEKASEWKNGIAGARDILADINDEVIVSSEKQQELSQAMKDVQREITEVAKAGQEERGSLSDLEIQRLDELFQKMHELAEQEVEVKKAYQKAVKTQAEIAAANKSTSLEEYEKNSQDIILTAERTNNQLINKAREQMTEELMLIDKKYGEQATMSNEAYANEVRAVGERKRLIIDAANAEYEETLTIIQKGYADIMIEQREYSTAYQDTLDQMRAKQKAHDAEMEQFAKEYYDNINKGHMNLITAQDDYQRKSEDSKIAHNLEMLELYNQYTENLSENATKENAILLDMVAQSGQSYDELNESTKSMVEAVLVSFKLLDEESRKTLNQALEGMGMEIDSHGDLLYTSGENAGKKVIDGFDSADIPTEFNEIANTGINSYLEPFDTSQELARTEVGKLKRASLSTLEQAKDDYYRQGLAAVSAYIKGLTSQKPPALGSLVELPKRSSSRIGEEVVQENLNIRSIAPIGIVDETNNFATNFAREMQSVRRQIQNVIPTNIHSTADISLSKKKATTSGFADQQNAFYFTIESFNNYSNEDAKQLAQTIMYEANNIYKRDRKVWA